MYIIDDERQTFKRSDENTEKSKDEWEKMMKSTLALYGVLLLAVMNLFVFIGNEDNESLSLSHYFGTCHTNNKHDFSIINSINLCEFVALSSQSVHESSRGI